MNFKFLGILFIIFIVCLTATLTYFVLPNKLPVSMNIEHRTDYSEGRCTPIFNTCKHVGEGCGGGHGLCSSFPQSPLSGISTCDINMDFPSMQNYECICLKSIGLLGKCGWAK